LSGHFGYRRGFDDYFDDGTFGGFDITMPGAVEWLRQNQESRFFLFVQGYDVHGRYALRKEAARDIFLEEPYEGRFSGSVEEYWELRNNALDVGSVSLTKEDTEFWRADYDAKIYLADELFGAFVDELRALDLFEKTVFVITSGSGNEYLEHGRIDHGLTLYDELVMVPLVIRTPNVEARKVERQVRTVDIMPTVMDLLDIDVSDEVVEQMRGTSLVPLMTGHDMTLDAFSETDYLAQSFKRSVRTADGWKFIYSLDTENKELYDLNTDPRETRNLVDEEQNIAIILENRLFNHLASLEAYD